MKPFVNIIIRSKGPIEDLSYRKPMGVRRCENIQRKTVKINTLIKNRNRERVKTVSKKSPCPPQKWKEYPTWACAVSASTHWN